jgi:hypothetical protein
VHAARPIVRIVALLCGFSGAVFAAQSPAEEHLSLKRLTRGLTLETIEISADQGERVVVTFRGPMLRSGEATSLDYARQLHGTSRETTEGWEVERHLGSSRLVVRLEPGGTGTGSDWLHRISHTVESRREEEDRLDSKPLRLDLRGWKLQDASIHWEPGGTWYKERFHITAVRETPAATAFQELRTASQPDGWGEMAVAVPTDEGAKQTLHGVLALLRGDFLLDIRIRGRRVKRDPLGILRPSAKTERSQLSVTLMVPPDLQDPEYARPRLLPAERREVAHVLDILRSMPIPSALLATDRSGRARVVEALSEIDRYPGRIVRRAAKEFYRSEPHPSCKLLVLNRYLFAVPVEPPSNALWFHSWWIDSDLPPSYILPLIQTADGDLQFEGTFRIYAGPPYMAIQEFDYFERRFGLRRLTPGGELREVK